MQVERPRVLLDRLAILGGRFGKLILRFEDLTGELVHPVRGGRLLEHSPRRVVEGAHVNAGSLIEHVGVVGILRFELAGDRHRLGRVALRAETLCQGQPGEARQVAILRLLKTVRKIRDSFGAVAGGRAR